ncbi:MAG TPA: phage holin family protein [Gammaproteobacteria bacterium]|nr:phage holin family protein [Gammaproteobacteria bacterium]
MQASTQVIETRSKAREDRSLGELFRDLTQGLSALVTDEVNLAKAEISEKVSQFSTGMVSLGIAAVVLLAGLIILLEAAVYGIALVLPLWAAALITGGSVFIIGLILLLVARSKLKPRNLIPARTAESLSRDKAVAQEELK